MDLKDAESRISVIDEEDDGIEILELIEDDDCPGGFVKVRSHIAWEECYAKRTPCRHMILNELADRAAGRSTDSIGVWEEEKKVTSEYETKFRRIRIRIACIEASVRVFQQRPPVVAADLFLRAEARSSRRHLETLEKEHIVHSGKWQAAWSSIGLQEKERGCRSGKGQVAKGSRRKEAGGCLK